MTQREFAAAVERRIEWTRQADKESLRVGYVSLGKGRSAFTQTGGDYKVWRGYTQPRAAQ